MCTVTTNRRSSTVRQSETRMETKTSKTIGTHDGTFHCDEALACVLLKFLPEFADATIVRTRDEEKLSACDVVVDVGGLYDPDTRRFDHHQTGFSLKLTNISSNQLMRVTIK